jgi:hypothetical protein
MKEIIRLLCKIMQQHTLQTILWTHQVKTGEWDINWGVWFLWLPILNSSNLWSTLTDKMCVKNPNSLELQENNRHEICTIPIQQIQHVSRNIFSQCEAFLEAECHHFKTEKYLKLNYSWKGRHKLLATAMGLCKKSVMSTAETKE